MSSEPLPMIHDIATSYSAHSSQTEEPSLPFSALDTSFGTSIMNDFLLPTSAVAEEVLWMEAFDISQLPNFTLFTVPSEDDGYLNEAAFPALSEGDDYSMESLPNLSPTGTAVPDDLLLPPLADQAPASPVPQLQHLQAAPITNMGLSATEEALARLGLPPGWLQALKPKGPNSLNAFHHTLKQRHGDPQWRQSAEYAQLETLLKNELDDVLAATWGQVTRENLDMELADLKAIFKHLHLAGRPAKVPGIVMVFRRRLMNNSYTRGTG